ARGDHVPPEGACRARCPGVRACGRDRGVGGEGSDHALRADAARAGPRDAGRAGRDQRAYRCGAGDRARRGRGVADARARERAGRGHGRLVRAAAMDAWRHTRSPQGMSMATTEQSMTVREKPEHVRNTEEGRPVTMLEAIREALWEEMERDERVFVIGEDIGVYGGAFKMTDGFLDHFGPKRVIDTPISEAGFTGAAAGAAHMGMRP